VGEGASGGINNASNGARACHEETNQMLKGSLQRCTLSLMSILEGSLITSSMRSASLLCRTFFSSSIMPASKSAGVARLFVFVML
jgi:hypothetical protein